MSAALQFEVLTPVGAVLLITPDVDIARAFVRDRTRKVPGLSLRIEEVCTTVTRRRIGQRSQAQLRVVGQ